MNKPQIFISYSSKDKKIAEQIHRKLESNGFHVWRDQTRLETNWSREIAFALADCNVVCLVWTDQSAKSKWVKHEWLTGRALEKLIIPCIFPNAPDLPKPLSNVHGIIFNNITQDCLQLIKRLNSQTSFAVKYDYSILPENCYIPFTLNPDFTGRHRDLLELYIKMIGNLNKIGINQVGTVGMGGIGKTQLVVEFAYRFSFAFDAIYWIQASDKNKWLWQFVELARDRFALKIPQPDSPEIIKQYIFALQAYLKNNPNILVIMDNIQEPVFLNNDNLFLGITTVLTLGCDLLFTTRKHFQLTGVTSQAIDILSPEASYAVLTHVRKPITTAEDDNAHGICNAVGYLPLALILAASYLKNYPDISFSNYRSLLIDNKLDTLDYEKISPEALATRHVAAVKVTIKSQWDMLTNEDAKHLFKLAGLFPETTIIPKARLELFAGIGLGKSKIDRPFGKALNQLFQLNLVEILETHANALRLHPLIRDFARQLIPEDEKSSFRTTAAERLHLIYNDPIRLETEYLNRGIDQVIDDFKIAIYWCEKNSPALREVEILQRLLDRERHNLTVNKNSANEASANLFQQLYYRAFNMGLKEIALKFYDAANTKNTPFLKIIAITDNDIEDIALIRTFKGHSNVVRAATFSVDGQRALSGSSDTTLILWDVESGKVLRIFKGHTGAVCAVCLSIDGRRALSGSSDKTLILWDVESGDSIRTFKGHTDFVLAVCLSVDGRHALSGSGDTTLILWDVESGKVLRILKGHTAPVFAVCLSVDGRRALSGSGDTTLILWDVESGDSIRTFKGHTVVWTVSLSKDDSLALSGSEDGTMILWDVGSGKALQTFEGHSSRVCAVCLSTDGRRALSGSLDKTMILWDVSSGKALYTFKDSLSINTVSLNMNRHQALSGSGDTMILWDVQRGDAYIPEKENRCHSTTYYMDFIKGFLKRFGKCFMK